MELKPIEATISKVTTMHDKTLRLQIDTQEIGSEQKTQLFSLHDTFGYFFFSEKSFKEPEITELPDVEANPKGKTPSQRLRNTLFVLWTQQGSKGDFEVFYRRQMDILIEHLKNKLI